MKSKNKEKESSALLPKIMDDNSITPNDSTSIISDSYSNVKEYGHKIFSDDSDIRIDDSD